MSDGRIQRRLAAILAADVVGYSRLIRADEEGTLARLKSLRRELIDPTIAEHGGRIVKLMGDGMLVEFPSVVDAVRSAERVQVAIAARNSELSESERMTFRVGVNLGDVVIDGDDIHGDGVNVAARLEGLAQPGGICISAAVYDQVRDRIEMKLEDLGEQEVKNIDRPIRAWHWVADAPASPGGAASQSALPSEQDKPSIAVLPFNNMSGDPEQEYFADGISEDIITDLSKVSGLFVIARNSSFAYKNQSPDIRRVCRELRVRYVLEGSVRKAGARVRINAQMIEGATGGHLWAERYDRNLEDIFAVQDEVTREIVDALKVKLTTGEKSRREDRRKVNPEAYDYLVRARTCLYQFSAENATASRALIERAIELDASIAAAYAILSTVYCIEYFNGWNNPGPDHLDKALELANKACEIDENEPQAYHALAATLMWLRQLEEAARAAERATELDPNYAAGFAVLGSILDYAGQQEKAVELLKKALGLDPQFHLALQLLGRVQFGLELFDEAEANFKQRLVHTPQSDTTRAYLASLYGHTGRHEEARRMWSEMLEINPDFSIDQIRGVYPYSDEKWFDRFVDGFHKAGLPD